MITTLRCNSTAQCGSYDALLSKRSPMTKTPADTTQSLAKHLPGVLEIEHRGRYSYPGPAEFCTWTGKAAFKCNVEGGAYCLMLMEEKRILMMTMVIGAFYPTGKVAIACFYFHRY